MRSAAGLAIGLLGGSFNPAHEGHLHVSRLALSRLALDQVWWLVSPQNPLKPVTAMAPFDERLAGARSIALDPRIHATGIEAELGTQYTADTLAALVRRYRRTRFVWLMGADNFLQIPKWRSWTQIFHTVPIAIFARPSYSFQALSGQAAHRFGRCRVQEGAAWRLADMEPPAWVYFHTRLSPVSATQLRARQARKS